MIFIFSTLCDEGDEVKLFAKCLSVSGVGRFPHSHNVYFPFSVILEVNSVLFYTMCSSHRPNLLCSHLDYHICLHN